MNATIYTMFREAIKDTTEGSYETADSSLFRYLDAAILKMSELHDYIFVEDKTITQTDLDNGYFTLNREPVAFLDGLNEDLRKVSWDYYKGKQIRIIDKSYFPTSEYTFRYRAKYKQFDSEMRDDDYFDFDKDAYFPIVLYAIGYYMKLNSVVNEDGSFGMIRKKVEENLQIEYAVGGDMAIANSPDGMMEAAMELFRELPNGQDMYFNVSY